MREAADLAIAVGVIFMASGGTQYFWYHHANILLFVIGALGLIAGLLLRTWLRHT